MTASSGSSLPRSSRAPSRRGSTSRPGVPSRPSRPSCCRTGTSWTSATGRSRSCTTPGHTPDCICLLDQENRQLFAGDTLATGPLYAHLPDSDLAAFTRSTRRLADEVTHQVDVVYPAHVLRYAAPAEFITQTADGFARISDGSAEARPGTDIFGEEVREFWFETFSITLPASPGNAI